MIKKHLTLVEWWKKVIRINEYKSKKEEEEVNNSQSLFNEKVIDIIRWNVLKINNEQIFFNDWIISLNWKIQTVIILMWKEELELEQDEKKLMNYIKNISNELFVIMKSNIVRIRILSFVSKLFISQNKLYYQDEEIKVIDKRDFKIDEKNIISFIEKENKEGEGENLMFLTKIGVIFYFKTIKKYL